MRIGVRSITITRAEGPISECGKPRRVTSWSQANSLLHKWSTSAPKNGGYDKCDFEVIFEDGETYNGRYDLVHWEKESPSLQGHVSSFVSYLAGRPPVWMKTERNKEILARYEREIIAEAERTAGAKQFLERYDL